MDLQECLRRDGRISTPERIFGIADDLLIDSFLQDQLVISSEIILLGMGSPQFYDNVADFVHLLSTHGKKQEIALLRNKDNSFERKHTNEPEKLLPAIYLPA